jgi:hypothetical protein
MVCAKTAERQLSHSCISVAGPASGREFPPQSSEYSNAACDMRGIILSEKLDLTPASHWPNLPF